MLPIDKKTFRSAVALLLLTAGARAQTPAAPAAAAEAAPAAPAPGAAAPAAEAAPPPAEPAPTDAAAPAETAPAAEGPAEPAVQPEGTPATSPEPAAAETDERSVQVVVTPPPPPPPPEPVVVGDAAGRIQFSLGLDLNFVGDEEFDLLSDSDVLPQASLRLAATVWRGGGFSLLGVVNGEYGAAGSSARGTPTHIDLGRVLFGAELRGHVASGLVGYARVLAGPALIASRVGARGQDDTLALSETTFACGGALGAAVRLYGSKNGPKRGFRLEAYAEGGYDFVSEVALLYQAGPDGPSRPEPLDLGVLSPSGAAFGFGLQGSY